MPTSRTTTKKKKAPQRAKAPSLKAVLAAARAGLTLAAAGESLGVADLNVVLKRSKRLAAAWERGQLLRAVEEVAGRTYVVPEAADRLLTLPRGTFIAIYKKDRIVRELWDHERFILKLAHEKAFTERVKEGDAKAIAAVQHLFTSNEPAESCDFKRLRPTQMQEATGFARQQILRWHKDHGLPRNADGSYNLAAFIAWHLEWTVTKLGGQKMPGDDSRESALERLRRVQADEIEGRVLPVAEHITALRFRAAWIVQLLSEAQAEQWSHAHAGQTEGQLKAAYLEAFLALRKRWCHPPADIEISEAARQKFEEGLALLNREEAG